MLFGLFRARPSELAALRRDVRAILEKVTTMSASFDRLTQDVATAVSDIASLSAQLKTAIANTVASGTPDASLDALSAQLEAAVQPLQAATAAVAAAPQTATGATGATGAATTTN